MRTNNSMIYGRNPVFEALSAQKPLDRILMMQTISGENIGEILRMAKMQNVPVVRVPQQKLNSLVRGAHQGIIAYGAVVDYIPLQDIISHLFDQGKTPFLLLVDGVTDVRNMGAIIRSAVCCGVDAILFAEKNAAPIHEDMIKTSAGAMMQIAFCREKSISYIVDTLKLNGIQLYSSDLHAETSLMSVDFSKPTCIVMGSEDKGISSHVRIACDQTFIIPMAGAFDSFNVAVATGIICFEVMKQRAGLV